MSRLRRALAGAALLVLLAMSTPPVTSESAPPTTATAAPATTPAPAATTPSAPSSQVVAQPPPRNRIAPDPPETVADAQAWALATLGPREYSCLDRIIWHESRWNPTAWNTKGSGAYGIPQAKPASRMAAFGADYMTNPLTQTRWAVWYVTSRYGSACAAYAFWQAHGWY